MNGGTFPSTFSLGELHVLEDEFETHAVVTGSAVVFETALYPTEKLPPYSVHRFEFGPVVKKRAGNHAAARVPVTAPTREGGAGGVS